MSATCCIVMNFLYHIQYVSQARCLHWHSDKRLRTHSAMLPGINRVVWSPCPRLQEIWRSGSDALQSVHSMPHFGIGSPFWRTDLPVFALFFLNRMPMKMPELLTFYTPLTGFIPILALTEHTWDGPALGGNIGYSNNIGYSRKTKGFAFSTDKNVGCTGLLSILALTECQ